jgi:hypothetical protein
MISRLPYFCIFRQERENWELQFRMLQTSLPILDKGVSGLTWFEHFLRMQLKCQTL